MTYNKYLLSLLICSSITFAGNVKFQVNTIVQNYVEKFKAGTASGHRSGITEAQVTEFRQLETDNSISDSTDVPGINIDKWKKLIDAEYFIKICEFKPAIIKAIKNRLLPYGNFAYSYTISDGRFEFKRNDLKMKNDGTFEFLGTKLDSVNLLSIADDRLKKLKIFNGNVEFNNPITGRLNGDVYQITSRYRRVFRGGIVMEDVSYIAVQLSSTGELISIFGKWPKLISCGKDEEAVTIEDGLNLATTFYQTDFQEETVVKGNETSKPISARLAGIALAWQPIWPAGASSPTVLTPCYATIADVTLENGATTSHYFSFPRLVKYVNSITK